MMASLHLNLQSPSILSSQVNGPAGKDDLNSIERLHDCQATQTRNKLLFYSTA